MEGNRPLRWVAIAAAAAVALVVAAVVVVYATVDAQAIARYAAAEVERLTGRTLVARGPITLTLWPRIAVVAHDVSLGNPPGASRPEMVRIKAVRGAVATWPLLRSRDIVAEGIELEGVDLVLESLPGGRGNWELARPDGSAATPSAPTVAAGGAVSPFRLSGRFTLVDATIAWRPSAGGPVDVAITRLDVVPQDGGRYAWSGTFDADGTRWTLAATTGDPVQAVRERVPLDVDATLAGGGVTLGAKGRVERRDSGPAAVLEASLAWVAGSERVARRSPELAREAGRLTARIDARDKSAVVGGINGSFGATKFDGNATIDRAGERPRIGGRMHVDVVDLARERPAAPVAAAPATVPSPVPGASPLARLTAFDADSDFVVDSVKLARGAEATNLRGRVVVDHGKLAADPIDVDVAGGRVALRVHADASTARARITADGRGIELAKLLGALDPGRHATGGATTFAVDLQGPLPSTDRFVARASGTIRADVGPMRLQGAALDAGGEVLTRVLDALNPFRRVDAGTEVQCIVARLVVNDGIARAERTLAAETSRLAVSASGTIDLRAQTLDLLVRPRARRIAGLPSVELAEVVRVSGPIRSPSVKLDSMGAAKTAITIGGAIASGGWSLLATPLLNAGDDPSPCATARAGGRPQASGSAPAQATPPPQDPLGTLRGLFKR